jgi:hypothetical protein
MSLLGATGLAIVFAPSAVARRWLAALALVLAAIFTNPWLALSVTKNITGSGVYERVFWLLPVPIAIGLAFVGSYARIGGNQRALVASLAGLALFLYVATERLVVSAENAATVHFPPRPKQALTARSVALKMCELTERDSIALAPQMISQVLVTLHGCGYPLMAGMRWMAAPLGEERRRNALVAMVGTERDTAPERITRTASWLREYGIDLAVMGPLAKRNDRMRSTLRLSGYELRKRFRGFQFWSPLRAATERRFEKVADSICVLGRPDARVLAPYGVMRAVSQQGCATPVLPLGMIDHTGAVADDDRADLEIAVAGSRDLDAGKVQWFERTLSSLRIDVVSMPLGTGKRKRRLLKALEESGFESIDKVAGHRVLAREPFDAARPTEDTPQFDVLAPR